MQEAEQRLGAAEVLLLLPVQGDLPQRGKILLRQNDLVFSSRDGPGSRC
jgi:hypothetical protein